MSKKFVSIKTKMFLLFIPFILGILGIFLLFMGKAKNDIIRKIYLENLSFTLKNVSLSLEFPLWAENYQLIQKILSEIENNDLIKKIIIYKDDKIFFIFKKQDANEEMNYIILKKDIKANMTSDDFMILPKKVPPQNSIIFYIGAKNLNEKVNKYFNFFLAFILFLLFILIIAFYYFVDNISVPIIELSEEINDIGSTRKIKRLKFKERNDELGLLAKNFEKMQEEIFKYSEELLQLNRSLEKKVAAKTEELNSKNEELKATVSQLEKMNENYLNINKKLQITLNELYEAMEKAKSANRAKSQFVSMISHELRTPLTSIIGYAQLLKNGIIGELNNNQAKSIENIESAAKDLLNIINDLIDVSKIELNKFKIDFQEVNIKNFLQDIETEIEPLFQGTGVKLKKDYQINIENAYFDPLRIKQVILNFISNALKFTIKGFIKFHVIQVNSIRKNATYDPNGEYILMGVEDTGIGIKQQELDNIFRIFYQVDSGIKRNQSGTGLGLSISKQIITLHKGRIFVESEEGKGSFFYFIIPIGQKLRKN